MNNSNYGYTMSSKYQMVGISRQGHYKHVSHQKTLSGIAIEVLKSAAKIRVKT